MQINIKLVSKKIFSSPWFQISACIGALIALQLLVVIGFLFQSSVLNPDYGYDIMRDEVRGVAALFVILSSMLGLKIASRQLGTGKSAMNIAKGLGIALGVPIIWYLMGTFAINNTCGGIM